jgi:preprotein translocase subunit SecD
LAAQRGWVQAAKEKEERAMRLFQTRFLPISILFVLAWASAVSQSAGATPEQLVQDNPRPPQDGVYAVVREAPTAAQARVQGVGHAVLLYDRKYSDSDQHEPPKYVDIDTSSFVPLILAGPPQMKKDDRGWALLNVTLAREHVKTLETFTRTHLGGRVAIVLDGEIVTMHKVRTGIEGGQVQITRCRDNACQILRAKLARD